MFTHLHVHSSFSFLYGTFTPEELTVHARNMGFSAIALTDKNGLYGAVRFYKACIRAGIKPIIGAEITLLDFSSIILLAMSPAGYRSLCRLITAAHLKNVRGDPRASLDVLDMYKEGLLCLTGGREGNLYRLISESNLDQALEWLKILKNIYAPHIYVELQNHGLEKDSEILAIMSALAGQSDIPTAATNDATFLLKEDYCVHKALVGIQRSVHHRDINTLPNDSFYIKTGREMEKCINHIDAMENTNYISDICRLQLPVGRIHPPVFSIPSGEPASRMIIKVCYQKMAEKYRPISLPVIQRLEDEIKMINAKDLAGYFLLVKDIHEFAKLRLIRCSVRGSAAGSLITYLLLGGVDPVEHNLLFERFLNEARLDLPDIDLDFDSLRRDEVIQYVMDKYKGRTAMVATVPTFRARGAIRKLGRTLGYPYSYIGRLTAFLPCYLPSANIKDAAGVLPELKDSPVEKEPELIELAKRISGLPFQLSVHLGGVIITPGEITDWVPVEMSNKGFPVAQYDKNDIEALGLIKLDLLGLRMHTAIRQTLDVLKEQGIELNIDQVPLDDEKTYRLLRTTDTVGIFQVESPGQRQLLGRLQPKNFSDIIAEISLFRPGPMEGNMINPYILRSQGREKVAYLHPALIPALEETYGVLLFQEQVLRMAHDLAGFSYADADNLRRAMTKDRSTEEMAKIKETFVKGCLSRGHSRLLSEKFFSMIATFAAYGFCKAHAASFAHITYQSAYLKAHYPLEFYLGLLNAGHVGSYPQSVFVNEARRNGIKILPPHVNYSRELYTKEDYGIRIGLLLIKGIGSQFARRIVQERDKGLFISIEDFQERIGPPEKILNNLLLSGALAGLFEVASLQVTSCKLKT